MSFIQYSKASKVARETCDFLDLSGGPYRATPWSFREGRRCAFKGAGGWFWNPKNLGGRGQKENVYNIYQDLSWDEGCNRFLWSVQMMGSIQSRKNLVEV